jgi:hypothetical protein
MEDDQAEAPSSQPPPEGFPSMYASEIVNTRPLMKTIARPGKGLGRLAPAEDARRQEQDRTHERKERFERHSQQPKGQRDQPDEWKKHQSNECERPGKDEENAPADKGNQRFHLSSISLAAQRSTARRARLLSLQAFGNEMAPDSATLLGRRLHAFDSDIDLGHERTMNWTLGSDFHESLPLFFGDLPLQLNSDINPIEHRFFGLALRTILRMDARVT